jgi:hypothetical protein
MKVTPIPVDTLPPEARPVCLRLERDMTALVTGGKVTPEQLKTTFLTLEDWAVRQIKLLVGTAKSSGAAA